MGEERDVFRWGGLSGLLAGILVITGTIIALATVAPVSGPEEEIMGYPERGATLRVWQGTLLVAAVLLVPLFLASYRTLRETSLAPALFGSVLGIVGLVFLAFNATNALVTYTALSNLYHAPGATPEEQATLVLLWQTTQEGIFGASVVAQGLFVSLGFLVLGVAMLGAPEFGKGFAGLIVVLGAVGVVAGVLSPIAMAGLGTYSIVVIILAILLGWKVFRLSRTG